MSKSGLQEHADHGFSLSDWFTAPFSEMVQHPSAHICSVEYHRQTTRSDYVDTYWIFQRFNAAFLQLELIIASRRARAHYSAWSVGHARPHVPLINWLNRWKFHKCLPIMQWLAVFCNHPQHTWDLLACGSGDHQHRHEESFEVLWRGRALGRVLSRWHTPGWQRMAREGEGYIYCMLIGSRITSINLWKFIQRSCASMAASK